MPETHAASVLITRPEPGASETAARVAALGFEPIVAPVLQIRRMGLPLPDAARIAAVLVTSSNALDGLPAPYHPVPLLAVGDATADRARAAGFRDVASAAGDAEALAALVRRRQDPQGGALLLACGSGQGAALATSLREAGFRVLRRVVYAAVPAPWLPPPAVLALRDGTVRAALFFSAESVRQFLRLARRAGIADRLAAVEAISISRRAAVALEALPWRGIRVAARPNQDAMLALLR